ncbi:hypothetical protein HDU79_008464 [Rhizoclosmatium sp. JEL0117]|nr:hypothetical protein HDU79_008464 [Rhizoclosmatium sp. JEL0117]
MDMSNTTATRPNKDKLKPRDYQRFIFEKAKSQNTIVVLPTGTGKTLISLLLIKHMNETSKSQGKNQVSIFLAPQVPLVMQQTTYLRQNLDVMVKSYHGELGTDSWGEEVWRKDVDECGCMVMTPAILEAVLRRGYIRMLFDECHNARKNSIYNQIISLHYLQTPTPDQPRIFGMTASPMSGSDSIDASIKQLEANLCCKAITPDSHSDLKHYTITPTKSIVRFKSNFTEQSTVLTQLIEMGITDIPQLRKLVNDGNGVIEDFGGWVCDVFLKSSLVSLFHVHETKKDRKRKWEDRNFSLDLENENDGVVDMDLEEDDEDLGDQLTSSDARDQISSSNTDAMDGVMYGHQVKMRERVELDEEVIQSSLRFHDFVKRATEVLQARWAIEDEEGVIKEDSYPTREIKEFSIHDSKDVIPSSLYSQMSSKFKTLITILQPFSADPDFCGIVFTEKRATAKLLSLLLPRCPGLEFVKVDCLTGHGGISRSKKYKSTVNDFSMEIRNQRKVVGNFREGLLNLLVATKVAEEGIDIQPCSLVIRFDNVNSVISNIQSRGRARSKNSRYILMVPDDDEETMNRLKTLDISEMEMNSTLILRQEQDSDDDDEKLNRSIMLTKESVFQIESGAKISIFNSIGAVYQYCSLLPHDSFANLQPLFTTGPSLMLSGQLGWISSLQLPVNAPPSCRFISGKPCFSSSDAKRVVALEAIKKLYAEGAFDDRLKPMRFDTSLVTDQEDYNEVTTTVEGVQKLGSVSFRISEYSTYVPEVFREAFPAKGSILVPDTPALRTRYLVLFKVEEDGFDRVLDIGILLPFVLPEGAIQDSQIIMIDSKPKKIEMLASCRPIEVNEERNDWLQRFSNAIFYNALLRTQPPQISNENEYLMPMVPLLSGETAALNLNSMEVDSLIDWDLLFAVASSEFSNLKANTLEVEKGKEEFRREEVPELQPESNTVTDFPRLFSFMKQELIVCDRAYWDRKFQVLDVLKGSTPFSAAENGFKSLADFYKYRLHVSVPIIEEQPVLLAIQVPHMYQSGRRERAGKHSYVQLIPQFCSPFPVPSTLLMDSALYMPLLIQNLYHRLCTLEIQRNLNLMEVATPSLFQSAFKSAGTQFFDNYERLEFLGDSYLKAHLTLDLFMRHPSKDEGWLSRSRIVLERNSNLMKMSVSHNLPSCLLPDPVSRKTWAPPMQYSSKIKVSDKATADIVEAIIGACVVSSGSLGGGQAVLTFFGPKYEADMKKYTSRYQFGYLADINPDIGQTYNVLIDRLHDKLGYRFKDVGLAVEAVTHTSASGFYELSRCYQRLEFLGDSILGYLIAHQLYLRPENLNPGQLSDMKSELVNNQFLAAASFQLGLHKLVIHASPGLAHILSDFGEKFETMKRKAKKLDTGTLFWHNLPPAPKTISDVLEALLGAVFLDSGCNLNVVERIIQKVLIEPWWSLFMETGSLKLTCQHPLRDFYEFADRGRCKDIILRTNQVPGDDKFSCLIEIHGNVIASCVSTSKRSAKKLAASQAVSILTNSLESFCTCPQLYCSDEIDVAMTEEIEDIESTLSLPLAAYK